MPGPESSATPIQTRVVHFEQPPLVIALNRHCRQLSYLGEDASRIWTAPDQITDKIDPIARRQLQGLH
jgi:hypothetical protein